MRHWTKVTFVPLACDLLVLLICLHPYCTFVCTVCLDLLCLIKSFIPAMVFIPVFLTFNISSVPLAEPVPSVTVTEKVRESPLFLGKSYRLSCLWSDIAFECLSHLLQHDNLRGIVVGLNTSSPSTMDKRDKSERFFSPSTAFNIFSY